MPAEEIREGFFGANKRLLKEWLNTRLEIYRLKMVRMLSQAAGHVVWIIISLFLLFLFIIFLGLTAGFWLSDLTGSHARGFGLVSLIIGLLIGLLALFRKRIFINPFIRSFIGKTTDEQDDADSDQQ